MRRSPQSPCHPLTSYHTQRVQMSKFHILFPCECRTCCEGAHLPATPVPCERTTRATPPAVSITPTKTTPVKKIFLPMRAGGPMRAEDPRGRSTTQPTSVVPVSSHASGGAVRAEKRINSHTVELPASKCTVKNFSSHASEMAMRAKIGT